MTNMQQGRAISGSAYRPMGDQHLLNYPPCPVDAVKWSEDNLIAVAAGHTAVIASPADITGPRGYAVIRTDSMPAELGCKPSCYENSVAIGLSCMLQSGPTGHTATSVRGLCWSPAGCTASGSCLLTLVASDGKVQIFGPPSAPLAARWELLVNLSDRLLQHMSDSNWQDAEQAAAAAVPGSEPLRLRGGGGGSKAKSQRKQQTAADHMDADTAGQQQQQQDLTAGAAASDKEATTADLPPAKRQKRAADALMQKAGSQPQQASEPAAKNIPSSVPAADAPHKTHEQQRANGYGGSKAAADVQATGSTGKLSAGNKSKKQGAADGAAATEATAVNPAEAAQGSTVTKKASKAMPGRRKSAAAAAAAAATGSNGSAGAKQADVTAAAAATVSVKAPGKKRGRKSAADKAAEAAAAALTPAASNKTQGNGSVAEDVADSADVTAADKDGKNKDGTDVQQQKSSKAGTSTKTPSSKKAAGKKASTPAADKTTKTPAVGKGSSKPTAGKPPKSSSKKSSAAGAKTSVARASSVTPSRDATPDPNAHLPRTAAGAAVFAVGDAVEVMNDEEGLRGAWWAGKILQLQHGFALVEYASLYEDEEGTQALKEWFPVPGPGPAADPDAGAAAAGGYYFHTDLSNMLRPQPPQEMLSPPGGKPQPGDCVEVYVDDGWWRTRVLSATAVAVTAPVGSATNIVTVPIQGGVRSLTVWDPDDGIWDYGVLIQHPPGTTAPPAGAEPPAAAAPTDKQAQAAEQPVVTAKAAKAAAKPRRGSAAGTKNWVEDYVPDIPGFSSDDDEDGAKPCGAGRGSAAAAKKGGKKKRRRAASGSDSGSDWAAESAQEESDDHELSSDVEEEQESEGAEESEPEGSDDLEVGVGRKGSSRAAGGIKLVSATAILPADKAQKPVAGRRLPHLSATAASAAAAGTGLGLAAAAAAAAAARAGASQPAGAAADVVDMVDAQAPAAATSVGGSAAVAVDGDVAGPLSAAGKRSATKKKGSKGSKAAVSQTGDGNEDDAVGDAESDGWVTEEEEGDPEAECKVPDGLDANTYVSLLPAGMTLDTADGWKKGAPRAMTVRFAQLREKVDPKKLPHYKKGQHLRKADMRLWTQVLAEFLHLHGKDLDARTDITTKQLVTLAKAAIRKSVIQSYSPYVRTDTANPYLTQGYVPRGAAAGAAAGSNRNPSSILQQAMSAAASEGPKRKVAGQKRKKDADAESVAAATLLEAAVEVGSVGPIGPVNLVAAAAEEQPEIASSVVLSQQVPGVEVQLSSSVRTGPSLKLQVNTVVSARDAYARCYAPYAAYARNNCSFQVLEGSMIETSSWECRRTFMAATAAAWSQTCITAAISSGEGAAADGQEQQQQQRYTLLAVGCKAGCVQLWRYKLPQYSSSTDAADAPGDVALQYLGAVRVTAGANVTSLTWTVLPATPPTTAAAAGGAISSSSCVVPGVVANKLAGDVLLLAVGTSVGEITLWSADPTAADAAAALQQLGTPLLPDQQTVLVQDLAVVASATTAVADDSNSSGWQLLLAAGKPLGRVAVWRSGHIISKLVSDPATAVAEGGQTTCSIQAYSQQQLSLAISGGSSSSMRCHGAGFVTGVMWNPWEQLLCTSGADGQVLMWTWENATDVQCARAPCRFNRQWLRPAPSSALAPARRAVAPVSGLAGSGARLCMAVARDWHVTLAAGELDAVAGAGGGGVRTNASAWEKVTQGALQLMSCYGPTDTAALEHVLLKQLVPALMWQGAVQAVLPAAAIWDVAVAIARCGWQSLKEPQQQQQQEPASAALVAPADDAEAAATAIAAAAAEESQQSKGKKRKNGTDAAGSSDDMAGVEALNARAELISKMAKKQAREIKLQCELLWRVVQAATAAFDATVAASGQQNSSSTVTAPDGSTSAAGQVYRPVVPAAAWVGLQLACYLTRCFLKLWQGPQAGQVSLLLEVGQLVIQLEQLLARWELELLQKHVYYALTQGVGYCLEQQAVGKLVDAQQQYVQQRQQHEGLQLPAAGVAAEAAPGSLGSLPLSEVLLADFVSQNIRHPDLNVEELLRPAAAVYASYGLMAPIGSASQGYMPARELNPVDPDNLPPVSVSGQGVAALSMADVHLAAQAADADSMEHDGRGTAVMKWPRCSSTLMLCQAFSSNSGSCWGCSNCGRRYAVPPCKALVQAIGGQDHKARHVATAVCHQLCVPACLVCGCRLCPGGAAFTGMPGATVKLKQTLDGTPVIGVGISLSDMLLPGC